MLLLPLFLLVSSLAFAQQKVTITIDDLCCASYENADLDGTFGLYGGMSIAEYPYYVADTLLTELPFQTQQVLTLEPAQYILRYTPNDTTQRSHMLYFSPHEREVDLTCFFFNRNYTSFIGGLESNEAVSFTSRYFGATNMDTQIPIYTLTIVRKRDQYYAAYTESFTDEQGLIYLDLRVAEDQREKVKINDSYRKLSTNEVQRLKNIEQQLPEYALDLYTGNVLPTSRTSIETNDHSVHFLASGYLSELMWKALSESER
jgi:hypothetical protein